MSNITAEELKERISAGEEVHLLDVREDWERQEFNIGGRHIPVGNLLGQMHELSDLKDKELCVYCRSGGRSGQAQMLLQRFGYSNVRNVEGGMLRWQELYGNTQG